MQSRTSRPRGQGDDEESSWSREFLIGQAVTLVIVAAALAFALISKDRGLVADSAQGQTYAVPAIGIGSDLAMLGPPVECPDTGALAQDCAILLSIRTTLAGDGELDWSADAPVSDWNGVVIRGQPPRVIALNLTTSGLSGRIPPELGDLSELRSLHLYGNELSGEIPPELGRLTRLETLDLGDNQLAGVIPPELGRLAGLVSLDLSFNQLSGPLPAQIGDMKRLEWLVIADNQLTGSISTTLESLPNLNYLSIYGNKLSGCIPDTLGDVDGFLGDLPFCDAR